MLAVFSVSHREVAQFEKLQGWICELGGCQRHKALIVSGFLNAENVDEGLIRQAARNFSSVELIRMWYEPNEPWPVPCNAMFQRAARHIYDGNLGSFWWHETDCIPLKSGWLDALEAEYMAAGKPFMGSIVAAPFRHLTGNAIYPGNIQDYSNRILLAHDLAWDVIDCAIVLPLTHHTDLYFHWWSHQVGRADAYSPEGTEFDTLKKVSLIPPQAVVVHRDKTGSVIDRLRERRKLILEWPAPSPRPIQRHGKSMAYRPGFGPRAKKKRSVSCQ